MKENQIFAAEKVQNLVSVEENWQGGVEIKDCKDEIDIIPRSPQRCKICLNLRKYDVQT